LPATFLQFSQDVILAWRRLCPSELLLKQLVRPHREEMQELHELNGHAVARLPEKPEEMQEDDHEDRHSCQPKDEVA
jgi:hypothetical protein